MGEGKGEGERHGAGLQRCAKKGGETGLFPCPKDALSPLVPGTDVCDCYSSGLGCKCVRGSDTYKGLSELQGTQFCLSFFLSFLYFLWLR